MRIGIDVRCFTEGRMTGVEEYTLNLLENLFKFDKKNDYILFYNSFSKSNIDFSWAEKYSNVKIKKFCIPNKILNLFFWYLHWPKIDRMIGETDVFFLPNIAFGSFSSKTKIVLTIHDLSFERYAENFSWKRRFWHIFINPKKICQRVNQLIAVSESSKSDLESVYRIPAEKITCVYSGISQIFKQVNRNDPNLIKVKENYNLPYKFILYLGTFEPRKNIIGIIKAFNHLRQKAKANNQIEMGKMNLVLAGYSGWLCDEIFKEIKNSPFSNDIFYLKSVPNKDKVYIYNLSSLFVYPSFFEGFGFPPLEAMSCEIPIISSNNSSLGEIINSGGILIDPDRKDEIYQAMKQILSSKKLQEKLKEEGIKQAANFYWQKTARETLKVFEKMSK